MVFLLISLWFTTLIYQVLCYLFMQHYALYLCLHTYHLGLDCGFNLTFKLFCKPFNSFRLEFHSFKVCVHCLLLFSFFRLDQSDTPSVSAKIKYLLNIVRYKIIKYLIFFIGQYNSILSTSTC